jgi:SpoVK/Ycf46/Vps4 family AAA+-type ATPase
VLLRTMDRAGLARPGGAGGAPASDAAAARPPAAPQEPARPLEELLAELDGLVGLAPVKAEVKLVANLIQVQNLRRERGLPVVESSRHLVFTGNPGTGKTTVARLLAQIYRTLRVVERGHLVETDRAGLVAGYVGQTALKVKEVFESALGGVLLIDEAYALARGGERDFGQEATDTLVKLMEDHRDDVAVIAAGYTEEMHQFVESNPGLRSRFPKTIHFPDYTTDELVAIFESMCKKASYTCTPEAGQAARSWFEAQPRDKGFGNARLARNLFEAAMARQASRLVARDDPTNEELMALLAEDVVPPAGA